LGQVVSQRELIPRRGERKQTGEGVVCAYGAFDLLHPGHIRLLEQAREYGKFLVVAVQSDAAVRVAAANAERPVIPAAERAEILAALSAVDFAVVTGDSPAEFLQKLRPDVFVCGDEADGEASSAARNALDRGDLGAMGCKVVRLPLEPGYSTTRLIERISGHHA
jgi:rfaE bifunctional protein nucleotidyltransferase chain/domain